MSDSELNLSVGALPPIFNDRNETALRRLINNFAGFAASRVNRQRKYIWLPRIRDSICQIRGANEHVEPPTVVEADDHERLFAKQKIGRGLALSSGSAIRARSIAFPSHNGTPSDLASARSSFSYCSRLSSCASRRFWTSNVSVGVLPISIVKILGWTFAVISPPTSAPALQTGRVG
jgi:hypothetical protein